MSNCDKSEGNCVERADPPVEPILPRCDVTLEDGVYTNATIYVENGCIVQVVSGDPFVYDPDLCCITVGGGGGSGGGVIGPPGEPGKNATISVSEVITVGPSDPAKVVNIGTTTNAVLQFYIPKGEKGESAEGATFNFEGGGFTVQNGLVTSLPPVWPPITSLTPIGDLLYGVDLVVTKVSDSGAYTIQTDASRLYNKITQEYTTAIEIHNDANEQRFAQISTSLASLSARITALEQAGGG